MLKIHLIFIFMFIYLYFCDNELWKKPKKIVVLSDDKDNNQQLFDHFSLTHVSHGIIYYYLAQQNIYGAIFLEILYELLDEFVFPHLIHDIKDGADRFKDPTLINHLGDFWLALVGISLTHHIPLQYQILYVLLTEYCLYIHIGHNMTTVVFKDGPIVLKSLINKLF